LNISQARDKSVWLLAGTVAYITLVFAIDFASPPPVDVWVLYLPLILLLTRLGAPLQIIGTAIVCTILMAVDILITEHDLGIILILVILGTRLTALWLVAISGIIIVHNVAQRRSLERDINNAVANEQQRIGREMHDSVGQELTALGLMVNALADRARTNEEESRIINRVSSGLILVQEHVRALSHSLVPVPVEAKGLFTALRDLAIDTTEKSGISVEFTSAERVEVPNHTIATHLFRIAQEAVNNALTHAHPNHIDIILSKDTAGLRLSIEDDGSGIRFPTAEGKGMGLLFMQYRAEQIGGLLRICRREGGGTVVMCTLMSWKEASDDWSAAVSAIDNENTNR
jgi:signal transduction histidine kinase